MLLQSAEELLQGKAPSLRSAARSRSVRQTPTLHFEPVKNATRRFCFRAARREATTSFAQPRHPPEAFILHRELGLSYEEITKSGGTSNIVMERTKHQKGGEQ